MNQPRKPFVFDIENAISNWRQFVSRTRSIDADDLDELEDHLRAELEGLRGANLTEEEQFRLAVRRIGDLEGLERAYDKVIRDKTWTLSALPDRLAAGFDLGRSYARAAWKGMVRHRGFAVLNLSGLALALAACILILMHVSSELGFDRYHEAADRIVRVEMLVPLNQHWPTTFAPVGPRIAEEIAGVERTARITQPQPRVIGVGNVRFPEDRFAEADPDLFEMFDFDVIQGDASALERPNTVMMSASSAERYFGTENPVGRTLQVGTRSSAPPEDFEVVGVYADIRPDSHFIVDFVASYATSMASLEEEAQWNRITHTYVELRPGVSAEAFETSLAPLWAEWVKVKEYRVDPKAFIQPLTRIHLHGELTTGDIQPQGSFTYILIFIGAAILLLIVACVNYINLTVARYTTRVREVGVRKVIGATRRQLMVQFYGEAVGYTLGALLLAGVLILLGWPLLQSNLSLSWNWQDSLGSVALLLVPAIALIALVAGSYPALFLSAFTPNAVLKGATPSGHRALFRKGLLIFQFLITSVLIVATLVVHRQLMFAQDTRFGFEQEQILLLPTRGALAEGSDAMKVSLSSIPGVEAVSAASSFPGHPSAISWFDADEIEDHDGEGIVLEFIWVDSAFVSTVGLELAEGRLFDPDRPGDQGRAMLLNEAAVRELGWQDPVGKRLGTGDRQREVIGVVRDFHTASMFEEIGPVAMELGASTSWIGLKVSTQGLRQTMAAVEQAWDTFIPQRPFEYSFLDDDFKAMYAQESRLASLFTGFSLLTIIIAILGLIGLVAFDGRQRRKEIGIRKSMGASTRDIVALLSTRFFVLVTLAFAVSIPISLQMASWWLERFAYRIEVSPILFAVAGGAILVVALVTVGVQAARSARVSPVECLRQD